MALLVLDHGPYISIAVLTRGLRDGLGSSRTRWMSHTEQQEHDSGIERALPRDPLATLVSPDFDLLLASRHSSTFSTLLPAFLLSLWTLTCLPEALQLASTSALASYGIRSERATYISIFKDEAVGA